MTDDRELREAFRSLVGSETRSSADVLAGMQPRLRRARLARGAGVAALVVPVIAGLGFALSSIDRSGEVAQTVSTDGGVAEVDDLDPPTPELTPEPATESEPDPSDDESDGEWTIVIATPTATPPPTSETDESDDASEQAEIGEPSSTTPSPTPSTVGQSPSPPVSSLEPEPTPLVTPSPTASPVMSMQYTSVGGTVDVEYTASVITNIEFSPAPGFTGEIHEQREREAKVIFSGPGDDIEIEIHLEDGQLTFQESGD